MPSKKHPDQSPEKLSIIVFSGDFRRIHYALATAAAAASVARPVTLFFTMDAICALKRENAKTEPGWWDLDGAAHQDSFFAKVGVATFEELLSACIVMNVRWMVCEMGMRAVGLRLNELRPDIHLTEGGIVSFLNDARADGSMLLI